MRETDPPDLSIDEGDLRGTVLDLVAIPSINPSLVEGGPGEAEIARYVADALDAIGLEVELVEPEPGRPSVVGRRRGTGSGPSLMWNGHLDTVGVEGMDDPFRAVVRDGRIHGRGAYDMKGSLAAMLAAARSLERAGVRLAGDLVLAFVADEEHGSLGTRAVLERVDVDGAIVTEPTDLELCVAHKGFAWIEVEARGRAAHGSRFDEGVDANLGLGRFLAAVVDLERDLRGREPHPLVGPPSLHVGEIEGGTGWSTYAARALARIERRTIPGESFDDVEAEIDAILDRLRREGVEAGRRTVLARDPFEAASDSPLAGAVESAVAGVLGAPPPRVGATYWMDAALCAAAGIDTVVIGPAGAGAHAAEEWVDLASCARLASVLAATAVGYCGGDGKN